jgi:hypothetical protein
MDPSQTQPYPAALMGLLVVEILLWFKELRA